MPRREEQEGWKSSRRLSAVRSPLEQADQESPAPHLQVVAETTPVPELPANLSLEVVTTVAHLERDLAALMASESGPRPIFERMLERLLLLARSTDPQHFGHHALELAVDRQCQVGSGEGAVSVVDGQVLFGLGPADETVRHLFLGLFVATTNRWLRLVSNHRESEDWRELFEVFTGELAREIDRINDQELWD